MAEGYRLNPNKDADWLPYKGYLCTPNKEDYTT